MRRLFQKDESSKKHKPIRSYLYDIVHVYNLKVCVFFFARLKLLVQYCRQSVLLRQNFKFRWNNETGFSFSLSRNFGYQVALKLCYEHFVNLFLLKESWTLKSSLSYLIEHLK